MNVEINIPKPVTEITFPVLAKHELHRRIALFSSEYEGILLQPGYPNCRFSGKPELLSSIYDWTILPKGTSVTLIN